MITFRVKWVYGLVPGALLLCSAGSALGGAHTWVVNEIFSNADGTIQFIELREANGTVGEVGVNGQTLSSNAESFPIGPPALTPPTSNKFFLIGTPAFAALPGAPALDRILPAGNIPFASAAGDTISYQPYHSVTYGSGVLPTNGILSLSQNLSTGTNSPTNYAGASGSVDASEPVSAPVLPGLWQALAIALLIGAGSLTVLRRRTRS